MASSSEAHSCEGPASTCRVNRYDHFTNIEKIRNERSVSLNRLSTHQHLKQTKQCTLRVMHIVENFREDGKKSAEIFRYNWLIYIGIIFRQYHLKSNTWEPFNQMPVVRLYGLHWHGEETLLASYPYFTAVCNNIAKQVIDTIETECSFREVFKLIYLTSHAAYPPLTEP